MEEKKTESEKKEVKKVGERKKGEIHCLSCANTKCPYNGNPFCRGWKRGEE